MTVYVKPKAVSEEEYRAYMASVEAQSIHGVEHWGHEVLQWAVGAEDSAGDPLPWSKCADFRLRRGEVTIWAGRRGHHKSFVTGQVAAWLARDVRVGIASFEMPPKDTIGRMIRQCAGCKPSPEYCMAWMRAMDPMIRIYDDESAMRPERVLAVIHHFAHDLGCSHVFIDSLMKVGVAPDDYAGQKTFVNELCVAAKRYGIHIHLVAHLRKAASKAGDSLPDADDISGGSDIANLAHNVVIVWNDKDVMQAREQSRLGFPVNDTETLEKRTHILKLDKQRNGRDQICWAFWIDDRSMQFLPMNTSSRMEWLQGITLEQLTAQTRDIALNDELRAMEGV